VLYVRRSEGAAWERLTCFAHEGAAERRARQEVESCALNDRHEGGFVVGVRIECRGRVVRTLARATDDYPSGVEPWRPA
jgi:hypothetical protein